MRKFLIRSQQVCFVPYNVMLTYLWAAVLGLDVKAY